MVSFIKDVSKADFMLKWLRKEEEYAKMPDAWLIRSYFFSSGKRGCQKHISRFKRLNVRADGSCYSITINFFLADNWPS